MNEGKCTVCEREIDDKDGRYVILFGRGHDYPEGMRLIAEICVRCMLARGFPGFGR